MSERKAELPLNDSRREFLKKSAMVAGGVVLGGSTSFNASTAYASPKLPEATRTVRRIGGLEVSPLGFGCMNLAGIYLPPAEMKEAIHVLQSAYEQGVTFFDTAQTYGPLLSEEQVGNALKSVRNNVIIASKFGYEIDPVSRQVRGLNSHPDYIRKATEGSLRRLQTDRIDLYYQHRIDPNIPIEDVAGAVQDLIKEGKVRYFGLSEAGAATIRRAHAVQPLASVTNEYSVWTRDPEIEVLAACEELGIALSPWSPIGPGFLTGAITAETKLHPNDPRLTYGFPRFTPQAIRANYKIVQLLKDVGQRHTATPGQVALAWLLARKPYIIPIPGTTKIEHLRENLGALKVNLTLEDLADIENGFQRIGVEGARFPPEILALSDTGAILGTSSLGGHGKSPLPKERGV